MIKYGEQKEDVINYVRELAAMVEGLNPLLIYVEQNDLDHSFRKVVQERPKEWSEGFIAYYTNQGYGKMNDLNGLEGTLKVLKARRELEEEIMKGIEMAKRKVDNSLYVMKEYRGRLVRILTDHFDTHTRSTV